MEAERFSCLLMALESQALTEPGFLPGYFRAPRFLVLTVVWQVLYQLSYSPHWSSSMPFHLHVPRSSSVWKSHLRHERLGEHSGSGVRQQVRAELTLHSLGSCLVYTKRPWSFYCPLFMKLSCGLNELGDTYALHSRLLIQSNCDGNKLSWLQGNLLNGK